MGAIVREIEKGSAIDRRKTAKEKLLVRSGNDSGKDGDKPDDSVMISDEARKRASGKHRKNILEYLEEDD